MLIEINFLNFFINNMIFNECKKMESSTNIQKTDLDFRKNLVRKKSLQYDKSPVFVDY